MVNICICVDNLVGATLLSSPLEIIVYADVRHTHVKTHVLLVAVPSAKRLGALVIFAERDNHTGLELPVFPIVAGCDYIDILSPTDFLTPEIVLSPYILDHKLKSFVH